MLCTLKEEIEQDEGDPSFEIIETNTTYLPDNDYSDSDVSSTSDDSSIIIVDNSDSDGS